MVVATEHRVSREDVIWGFGPHLEPVLEVEPGSVVTFETNDCFTGQIQSEDDLVTAIDFSRVNSATGPVELLDVRPGPKGFATIIPEFGQLIDDVDSPVTFVFDVEGDTVRMNDRVSFQARPMVGVVGVATGGEEITNGWAGRHGGNLDNHLHGRGAKIYFPVSQPGGMFAVGDMHAAMGDGEICGTGVEIAGEVTVRFDILKGKQARWPVTELAHVWATHATSGGDVREALQLASEEAARALVDEWDFTKEEAFVFLSVACDLNICQACQPSPFSSIARVAIPKTSATPRPFAVS